MKMTSIFLILATVVAMMFTGCNQIVGEDTTATLEDFAGTWSYKPTDPNKDQLLLTIEGTNATLQGLSGGEKQLFCEASNGILTVGDLKNTVRLSITVVPAKTMIYVTDVDGTAFRKDLGDSRITMIKQFDIGNFVPDTTVTYNNYIDTWVGKTRGGKTVKFTFTKQNVPTTEGYIQSANITGLTTEPLAGLVAVIKGTATITITNDSTMLFTMYMNKTHDAINVTGTSIKNLTGSLALNLKRAQ